MSAERIPVCATPDEAELTVEASSTDAPEPERYEFLEPRRYLFDEFKSWPPHQRTIAEHPEVAGLFLE